MKQNILLFLKSLVSNNTAIDGARKKPWYAAVIIFFFAIILSVIPTSVMELKNHADKKFDSTTFGLTEAAYKFGEYTKTIENDKFYIEKDGKEARLVADEDICLPPNDGHFVFRYSYNKNVNQFRNEYHDSKLSYVIFTEDCVYFTILDPNTHDPDNPVVQFVCANAYKKLGRDDLKNFLADGANDYERLTNTFSNFKGLIRKLYRQTRLKLAAMQLGISSAVTVGITAIMGFMIWILTRGKNNPYRLFTVWQCFATAFWASFTPGLLTVGLGFLIKNFALMIFPLLMGVRCMWLTMKSLRPDGSGYATN